MLEQMLDITLEEDAADLKKRLQSMSKDELIAELLKTKVRYLQPGSHKFVAETNSLARPYPPMTL